jgi:hypothetical protein
MIRHLRAATKTGIRSAPLTSLATGSKFKLPAREKKPPKESAITQEFVS